MSLQNSSLHCLINIRSNKHERYKWKAYAESKGMGLTEMIRKLIEWRMSKEGIGEYKKSEPFTGDIEDMPLNL